MDKFASTGFCAGFFLALASSVFAADLPDPVLTPGAVVATDRAAACAQGLTPRPEKTMPERWARLEREIFAAYGIPYASHRGFELDHLVPRCLGGADTAANLWPQRCERWGRFACAAGPAADKDIDEHRLCRAACKAESLPVEDGQEFFFDYRWPSKQGGPP